MLLERILVPVDFSDSAATAVKHAAALARHFHSQVTLLHVNEFQVIHSLSGPLGFGVTSWEAVRTEHLAARHKQLEQFAAKELTGVRVRRILCCGDPAKIIVDRARDEASDLILMPTRGGGLFRRFLLGSVAAKVLHDAEAPVWTGAHMDGASTELPTHIRRVVCAVNFGPQSGAAIRWAANFAAEFGARLSVIHAVLENPPNLPDRYAFQWHAEAHSGAEERLRMLLLDLGVHADVQVVADGDVPNAIATALHQEPAGLLVIGRHCDEGGKRLGSDSYGIICHAPCAVVSV